MPVYAMRRKRKKRFLLPLLVILVFGAGIFGAVQMTRQMMLRQSEEGGQAPYVAASENAAERQSAEKQSPLPTERITFTHQSVLHLTYLHPCGHTSTETLPVPDGFAGKTLAEVKEKFAEYTITSFSPGTSFAEKKVTHVCNGHYILRLEGQKLVVARRNNPGIAEREMMVDINLLPLETIEILNKGIFIESETELLEFLENFAS